MGNLCLQCFDVPAGDVNYSQTQEDAETRRQKQAEAALKRQKEDEGRGLKNPELVKAKQKRREEIEKKAESAGRGESNLRWAVD